MQWELCNCAYKIRSLWLGEQPRDDDDNKGDDDKEQFYNCKGVLWRKLKEPKFQDLELE